MTIISDALTAAEKIIAEHGIDLDDAIMAYQSMHPQLNRADARFTLRLEIASMSDLDAPYTTDSWAQQMADKSGAFKWSGPVGNGFTLDEYRDRWRRIAAEKLFLGRQVGLIPNAVD